jgi:methyl-accepting chemotaxis protein
MGSRLGYLGLVSGLAILIPLGLFGYQAWRARADLQRERSGSAYLQAVWPGVAALPSGAASTAGDVRLDAEFGADGAADALRRAAPADRMAAASAYLAAIADGAGLSRDSAADCFYEQDAAAVRLPALLAATSGLEAAAAEPPTAATRAADVAVALNRLTDAADAADRSLSAAMKNDPSGAARQALEAQTAALIAAATRLASAGEAAQTGAAADVPGAEAALQTQIDRSWRAATDQLVQRLDARLMAANAILAAGLGIGGGGLVFTLGLLRAAAGRLSARMRSFASAARALAAGDGAVVPHLGETGEFGALAAALASIGDRLADRDRLDGVALEREAVAEDRRRQVEQALSDAAAVQAEVIGLVSLSLDQIARGDLTGALGETFPEAFEHLRANLNRAIARLTWAFERAGLRAQLIRDGTEEMARASDDLSRRTEQQAQGLGETATALDQITATVKRTAEGARQANEAVGAAKAEALHSSDVVSGAVSAMGEIEKSSQQISQIIGVIDEIAFQTNLLALNAGVEAARAGDAGRGFAVVAQEVRALAQRTAEAAREIKALISASSQQVGRGVSLVGETGKALQAIVAKVGEIDSLVVEIASSAEAQATGLAQVNSAVGHMEQVVQQNAAVVAQSAAASHNIKAEADDLSKLISRFGVRNHASAFQDHSDASTAA